MAMPRRGHEFVIDGLCDSCCVVHVTNEICSKARAADALVLESAV
jgi:hypothetical protein